MLMIFFSLFVSLLLLHQAIRLPGFGVRVTLNLFLGGLNLGMAFVQIFP